MILSKYHPAPGPIPSCPTTIRCSVPKLTASNRKTSDCGVAKKVDIRKNMRHNMEIDTYQYSGTLIILWPELNRKNPKSVIYLHFLYKAT